MSDLMDECMIHGTDLRKVINIDYKPCNECGDPKGIMRSFGQIYLCEKCLTIRDNAD